MHMYAMFIDLDPEYMISMSIMDNIYLGPIFLSKSLGPPIFFPLSIYNNKLREYEEGKPHKKYVIEGSP